jgi:competence protein ComEC
MHIVKEPLVREKSIRYTAEVISVNYTRYDSDEYISITTAKDIRLSYGDSIRISGTLTSPQNFITDTGREFNYISYLKKESIFYEMKFPEILEKKKGEQNKILALLLHTKNLFLANVFNVISGEQAGLAIGMLTGVTEGITSTTNDAFIKTGTIHIVALSGYNVTIIAESIMKILSFLPFSIRLGIGSIAIISFAIAVGGGATVIRATIMALLGLLARATGRMYVIGNALLFAATSMVLHNPYILLHDLSFQLSFLATIGLVYVTPLFTKYFTFIPERFGLRDVFSATVCIEVFVLPFLLYATGTLSVIAPIANLLIVPIIPCVMLLTFIVGICGPWFWFIALPVGFMLYGILSYQLYVITLLADIPYSAFSIKGFSLYLTITIYIVYTIYLLRRYRNV